MLTVFSPLMTAWYALGRAKRRMATAAAASLFLAGCTSIKSFNADTVGTSGAFQTWTCGLTKEIMTYSIGAVIVLLVLALIMYAVTQYGGSVLQTVGVQPPSQQLVQSIIKGTLAFMLLPALVSVIAGVMGNSGACTDIIAK